MVIVWCNEGEWALFLAMYGQCDGNVGCNVFDFNDFGHCEGIVFALPNNEKRRGDPKEAALFNHDVYFLRFDA